MSDRDDMGLPPRPEGADQAGATGHDAPAHGGIMPYAAPTRAAREVPGWVGMAWCAVGGAMTSVLPLIACILVGYGVVLMAGGRRAQDLAQPVVTCMVSSLAASLLGGTGGSVEAVAAAAVACVLASLVCLGLLRPGTACAIVGIGGLCLLCADELAARLAGTSLAQVMGEVFDAAVAAVSATSVEAKAAVTRMRSLMDTFWPLSYVVIVLFQCLLAWSGARLAAAQRGLANLVSQPFEEFDLPLWPVALLVCAILGAALGAGLGNAQVADLVSMVSLNAIMALRFAFLAQGLAVLVWLTGRNATLRTMRPLVIMLAVVLETSFLVVSIVGLADVWLNLRRLARGGTPAGEGPTQQV